MPGDVVVFRLQVIWHGAKPRTPKPKPVSQRFLSVVCKVAMGSFQLSLCVCACVQDGVTSEALEAQFEHYGRAWG